MTAFSGIVFAGHAQRQMPSRRMADYDRRAPKNYARSFDPCHNVFERARPTPARLAYPAILEIGCNYAFLRQCGTEGVRMAKIVLRPPEPAMEENHKASHRALGLPQFEKLSGVLAIRDVFRVHFALPASSRRNAHGKPRGTGMVHRHSEVYAGTPPSRNRADLKALSHGPVFCDISLRPSLLLSIDS